MDEIDDQIERDVAIFASASDMVRKAQKQRDPLMLLLGAVSVLAAIGFILGMIALIRTPCDGCYEALLNDMKYLEAIHEVEGERDDRQRTDEADPETD